jgi:structural maintenance of chromosome 1
MERLAPNLKASEKFDEMAEKVKTVEETHNVNAKRLKTASQKFEDIKQLRIQSFIDAFDHVSKAIEEIYAALTKSPGMLRHAVLSCLVSYLSDNNDYS